MTLLDKLNITPGKTIEGKKFDTTIEEGETFEAYIFNAKKFLDRGDLESTFLNLSKAFHKETPNYYRCARLFETLAIKYEEVGDFRKALENIEYSISSWIKEAERLKSQERDVESCHNNIERLEKISINLENKINSEFKIKRGN
ncbi:hypothetical protein KO317_00285 [Candidatus Micrarchaeota archaeon]|nr:hypothetical protein [Candidatus Micrarchaeota archaeon]